MMPFLKVEQQMLLKTMFGERAIPNYHFEKAHTIVSFGADFIGDWQGGI